jgi:hypothetical protein
LNLRPSGYEPDELPGCSTPRKVGWQRTEERCPGEASRADGRAGGGSAGADCWSKGRSLIVRKELLARPGDDPLSHR